MAKIKPGGKLILFILVAGAAFGGYKYWLKPRFFDDTTASLVPKSAQLPTVGETAGMGTTVNLNNISDRPANVGGPQVRFLHWAWNAQAGLILANGGRQTTAGSLMANNGVNLLLTRQDDATKMQEALVAFATDLKSGNPQPTNGANFVAIMGDGSAAFLKGVNDTLRRLGPGYTAKVIGSCGYSRGEDKFMGPASWKRTPASARGGVVSGYLRDGDWNIALKWAGDNNIKNNPDETTWDPDALNWVAASDYIDAAEKYVANYTETRDVVRNGRRTGEKKTIRVDGVVTWTPGDVTVAKKRGGIVSIVSTREYASQMPNVIIGIDRWCRDNRTTVEGMLSAIFAAGDAIKSSDVALRKACEISADVFNEQGADAGYWYKYFKGVTESDAQGLNVELGGSSVNNLSDNMLLFGLVPGSANLFAATYTVFGDVVVQQYPKLVPGYDPVESVLDTSYIKTLVANVSPNLRNAQVAQSSPSYDPGGAVQSIGSKNSWRAFFGPGGSTLPAGGTQTMRAMLQDLLVASGAVVEIHGHADGLNERGDAQSISESRAFAVKKWLERQAPVNFPAGRIRVVSHGSSNPIEPNTKAGSVWNRRIEIVLGTTR